MMGQFVDTMYQERAPSYPVPHYLSSPENTPDPTWGLILPGNNAVQSKTMVKLSAQYYLSTFNGKTIPPCSEMKEKLVDFSVESVLQKLGKDHTQAVEAAKIRRLVALQFYSPGKCQYYQIWILLGGDQEQKNLVKNIQKKNLRKKTSFSQATVQIESQDVIILFPSCFKESTISVKKQKKNPDDVDASMKYLKAVRLKDFIDLDFNQEKIDNAKFRDLKDRMGSWVDYQKEFEKLPESSEMYFALERLATFWNQVLDRIPSEHALWEPKHQDALLMKARNHLELIGPIDEVSHHKRYLCNYWVGHNRPHRYDRIDELLRKHNNGNVDHHTQDVEYVSKREQLERWGITLQGLTSSMCILF
eukprot:TRINITY_DN8151_c0_g1_i3.p1 TRINITY_DN8151_c0_g1~~TRINITY_DN8151_c0_g1_i3.p1  ORF type:complete len:361 (-),score=33.07 TRINITY_DN8151_c0_g1_i3:266-1348(-)